MQHEYEARFYDVNHDRIRRELHSRGAERLMPRRLLKRVILENGATQQSRSWLRLRTDGERTTLTLKRATGDTTNIESIRELGVGVSDFESTQGLLEELGLKPVRYQENYREEWRLDDVIYDLDEWPGLAPFLEIEGPDPDSVNLAAKTLGLDFSTATFGSVDELYLQQRGRDILREPQLVFAHVQHSTTDSSSLGGS
jgi:adenylate cyclase class 2